MMQINPALISRQTDRERSVFVQTDYKWPFHNQSWSDYVLHADAGHFHLSKYSTLVIWWHTFWNINWHNLDIILKKYSFNISWTFFHPFFICSIWYALFNLWSLNEPRLSHLQPETEKSCYLTLKQRYVNVPQYNILVSFFNILCTIMTKLSLLRAELKYIHSHTENLQK